MRKKPRRSRFQKPAFVAWKESYSLGIGFLFVSLLSLLSPSLYSIGFLIFLMGVYCIVYGRWLKNGEKTTFNQWINLKVVQSLILVTIGIFFMRFLPGNFFVASFLLVAMGVTLFLSYKVRYLHEARK